MSADSNDSPKHLYLVDGSGYIFRAFFALPPMNRADGTPTNAVFGVTSMLLNLIEQTDADYVAVIFDAKRINFRNDIYPDYKGHRPDAPEELIPQFPLIHEAVAALSLPAIQMEGYEADDLIATYAEQAKALGAIVTVVSSDKDLMQLVDDKVSMWDPMKNIDIKFDQVMEKFGVGPDRVVDVQALAGDSSDNVPGVPGIGIKTAAQLINDYGDLDTLLERASEIKQPKRRESLIEFADQARISRQLVTLVRDVDVPVPLTELKRSVMDKDRLMTFLQDNNFKRLIARVGDGSEKGGAQEQAAAAPTPTEATYELVQDVAVLKDWIAAASKKGTVAVDTETTSVNQMRAKIVGVSLAIEAGKACYIPLSHVAPGQGGDIFDQGGEAPKQIPKKEALDLLKPLLEDPGVLKIGQNIKYDAVIFAQEGISVGPIDDTMLISFVLEGGMHGHGMDELSELHLDHSTISFSDVAGKGKSQVTFDQVPLDKACDYAAEDADITLRLWQKLKPQLLTEKLTTVYETIERPLVPILAEMERTGIKVDPTVLRAMSKDFAHRLADLEVAIHKDAGREFNVGSPKQLGEVLFDEMGLQGGKKTKTGAYSTNSEVLEPLRDAHPIVARLLDWRMLSKLKSTYTDALVEDIHPETGRVHTSYMMTGAQTGRLSSTDPNLQNIPIRMEEGRKIRQAFVAPQGSTLISLDYSQIELRLVAHVAKIEPLIQAFLDGQDIHAATASEVFNVPMADMTPDIRRKAKAINFGIIYGISAFGLANQIGVSRGEAQDFITRYFQKFPGIQHYMDETVEYCRKHGRVETLFGRRIHIPTILDKNPMRKNYAERQSINAPIQGTAADIIKRAMIRIPKALADAGLTEDAKMLLQVHDELVFEAKQGREDAVIKCVKDTMQNAANPLLELSVPLVVEAGTGANWAEAH
ncbi:MAG: DNA polymerase I [Rhodospirillales bacterium]|jgi:DNA polymerase-1|uniref:DNA polymerase I n=1 Tax=Hwanghaeella sp. 1Z406 TaxID=3402811 RepID=UPI000C8F0349|nr:DNA polymerase I [Rhodospirillales bacterium]|tara:strand:- start:15144 stop:17921 length:2778 start_codon:yes stop_codon:yes gene_type:complete